MDRREFLVAGAAALATTGCVAESARIADAGVETPTANGEKAESSLIVSPPVLQNAAMFRSLPTSPGRGALSAAAIALRT